MKAEIIRDTEDHITEAAVTNSETKFVPAGSVLMVMRSGISSHTFRLAEQRRILARIYELFAEIDEGEARAGAPPLAACRT